MLSSLKVQHTSDVGFFKKGQRFDSCERRACVCLETKLVQTDFDKWNMEMLLFHTFLYGFIKLSLPVKRVNEVSK